MNESRVIPVPQLDENPDLADPRLRDVAKAKKARDHASVRRVLMEMLRDRPGSAVVLTALSSSYADTSEWASCLQFTDAAVRLRPDVAGLHLARAKALLALDRNEEARFAAEQAVIYSPSDEQALGTLIAALFRIGTEESRWAMVTAIGNARRTMPLSRGTTIRNAVLLGDALGKLGLRTEARRVFADVFATEPDHAVARAAAAAVESSGRRWNAAIGHLSIALRQSPDDPITIQQVINTTRQWCGRLAVFAGTGLALAAIAEWVLSDPSVARAYALVGLIGFVTATLLTSLQVGRDIVAPMRIAVRDPRTVVIVLVTLLLAGGIGLGIAKPDAFEHSPGAVLGMLGCFVAVQVVVGAITIAWLIGDQRLRSIRHRAAMDAAIVGPASPPPPVFAYAIETPATGQLLVIGGLLPRPQDVRFVTRTAEVGVTMLVSTATELGNRLFRLGADPDPTAPPTVEFVTFPIQALCPPSEPEFAVLISAIVDALLGGECVGVVCPTGAERSALVAAAVCVRLGVEPQAAWARVERARGATLLVSHAQRVWLDAWHAGQQWRL